MTELFVENAQSDADHEQNGGELVVDVFLEEFEKYAQNDAQDDKEEEEFQGMVLEGVRFGLPANSRGAE